MPEAVERLRAQAPGPLPAVLIGAFAFGERLGGLQLAFVSPIVGGAVGLRLTTPGEQG